ncbi:ATP-binding protein [Streptomyces vinaceus]|uniref:ATP-binding protein n=1 Tax=Streptomyces vinaceus TaxID=1960 RepID=UPI0038194C8A
MPIAAPLLDVTLLRQVGVPDPLPVLDQAEVCMGRSEQPSVNERRPRQIRRIVMAWLSFWDLRQHVDEAGLLLSELVTNAFRHGQGNVQVRMFLTQAYLAFEVRSGSTGAAAVRHADECDESGRGLWLVEEFSDRWGVSSDNAGVWCTLPIPRPGLGDADR